MRKGRFRVGEYAILARPKHNSHLTGEHVQIVQQEEPKRFGGEVYFAYTVQVLTTGDVYPVVDDQLDPLEPPNTPSTWENCLWKPQK